MAAMSAIPQEMVQNADIVRTICSDPRFIATIYDTITNLFKSKSNVVHVPTVIGGAAFILYAYVQNGNNGERMELDMRQKLGKVLQTSDIDIAIWYKNMTDKTEFKKRNALMENEIRRTFTDAKYIESIKEILSNTTTIDTITVTVPESVTFSSLTTKIPVYFMINGKEIKVDIAIKNAIYSQRVNNGKNVTTIPIEQNVTYTNDTNTLYLRILPNAQPVRVPTVEQFIKQQIFAFNNINSEIEYLGQRIIKNSPTYNKKYIELKTKLTNYKERLSYLSKYVVPPQHPTFGTPEALADVYARTLGALRRANHMSGEHIAALARPASLSRPTSSSSSSGLPPLPPKKGGKRRTYRKNKRHTKRRHTKRN
jgi:hypothetical protein